MKTLVLIPTDYCNFSCEHCGALKSKTKNYIDMETCEKLFGHARKEGFDKLHITGGGEPSTDFDKWLDIIRLAKTYGFKRVSSNSNGSFINSGEDTVTTLKSSGLDTLVLSIDKYHLKYLSYENLKRLVDVCLNKKLKVKVTMASAETDKRDNLEILRTLAKDMGGIALKLLSFDMLKRAEYVIVATKRGIIPVQLCEVFSTDNDQKIDRRKLIKVKPEFIALSRCFMNSTLVAENGDIMFCCYFHGKDTLRYYKIKNVRNLKNEDVIEELTSCMRNVKVNRFPFLITYLKIKKSKQYNKILEKEYVSECDFCKFMFSSEAELSKLPEPTKIEIIGFMVRNAGTLLKIEYFRLKNWFTDIILKSLQEIYYKM